VYLKGTHHRFRVTHVEKIGVNESYLLADENGQRRERFEAHQLAFVGQTYSYPSIFSAQDDIQAARAMFDQSQQNRNNKYVMDQYKTWIPPAPQQPYWNMTKEEMESYLHSIVLRRTSFLQDNAPFRLTDKHFMKLWVAWFGQQSANHNELVQFILKRIDLPFITVMEQVCARVNAPMQSSNLLNFFYAQAQGKLTVARFCSIMKDKYDNIKTQLSLLAALMFFVRNILTESYRIKLSKALSENRISSWYEMRREIQFLKQDYPNDARVAAQASKKSQYGNKKQQDQKPAGQTS
jgi:hypothetical protein